MAQEMKSVLLISEKLIGSWLSYPFWEDNLILPGFGNYGQIWKSGGTEAEKSPQDSFSFYIM